MWPARMRYLLIFVFLVLLGIAFSMAGSNLIHRFGTPAVIGLALVVPPLIVYLLWCLGRAFSKFRVLLPKLHWYHTLWLFVLASSFVIRLRDMGELQRNPLDAAALYRVGLVGITAFILIIRLVLHRTPWMSSLFRGLVGVMAAFALMCALSTLWSVNVPFTLYKSLEYLTDVILLAAILVTVQSVESYEVLFDWTWVLTGLLVASAWIEAPIWPQDAFDEEYMSGVLKFRISGVFPGQGSNALGTFGAIIAVIAFARLLPAAGRKFDRAWYGFVLMIGIVTMVCTQTRSAMGGFFIGAILVLLFTNRLRISAALGVVAAAGLAWTGASGTLLAFLQRGQNKMQMLSLTGRVQWWSTAWQVFKQRPFSGFGAYAAGFAIWPKLGEKGFGPLHSDYIEVLVGNGIWGPLPILIALVGTWWILVKFLRILPAASLERQLAIESVAVLAIVTTRSVVMNLIILHPPIQYFVLLGYAEYLRRRYGGRAPAAFET